MVGDPRLEAGLTSGPESVLNVPAALVAAYPDTPLIVRVGHRDDIARVGEVSPRLLAWVETSAALAESPWPAGVALDVVLADPEREAPLLYRLARLGPSRRVRVTIPAIGGVAKAGALAVALRLPVRLLPGQPGPEAIEALEQILDRYLHDPGASEPVEFFHSALAMFLHGDPATLWEVLEQDPAAFPRVPGAGEPVEAPMPPQQPGFAAEHLARLVVAEAECAECPYRDWCAGFFKWPDPVYACTGVRRLLRRIEDAAHVLRRDLIEAQAMEPEP